MASIARSARPAARNAPVIVLLGFGGAQDKHLQKYARIYEDRGCEVVRVITPFGIKNLLSNQLMKDYAQEVYARALVDVSNQTERPILIQAFSMNGASLFSHLWRLLDDKSGGDALKAQIKGIIFDSAPADTRPMSAANAFIHGVWKPGGSLLQRIFAFILRYFVFMAAMALRLLQRIVNAITSKDGFKKTYIYHQMLEQRDLPTNQCFLFSKTDTMIDWRDVEHFAAVQQSRGVVVKQRCWPASSHVAHLRQHENEYKQLCTSFLAQCIEEKAAKSAI